MASGSPVDEVTRLLGGSGQSAAFSQSASQLTEQLTTITQQLTQLQTVNQTQIDTLTANTTALAQNTSTKGASGGSTVGSTIESVLGFGLGLSPLISGLVSLFGGGGSAAPAPLVPYVAPLPVNVTAGIGGSTAGAFGVDTAAEGLPRPQAVSSSNMQITVQVQAMDSQSFLDHSNDIALAVRQAMLTSTTLNDVIREV